MHPFIAYLLIALSLGMLQASPVLAAKIKHQGTVYLDSAEKALNHPEGVACGADSFVVADTGNSQVVRYTISIQGLKAEAVFPVPDSVPIIAQTNAAGEIYLLDGRSRTIIKLNRDGKVSGKIAPQGLPGTQTVIPRSFRLDAQGQLYLLDIFTERVLVLDATGKYLRHLAFPEGYRFFSDLALGPQGGIYLLDSVAGAIYFAGPGAESFAVLSSGLKEHMNFPTSLALDSKGTLYLSDQYGSGLALVGRDGGFQGRKFSLGWEDGQLYYPSQLCINEQDLLVIADRDNNRVQVFNILEE